MENDDMTFQNIAPHQHLASLTLFAPVNRTSTVELTFVLPSIVPLLPKFRRLATTTGTSNMHTGWVLDAIMDHYPLPDLHLITDTYWRRRNGYYRQKLMDMDHGVDEGSFTTTIPKPKRSMTLKERLLKRHKQ